MKLNELQPKEGSVKERTRVGRGIASGKGKTAGKGHKGQKARKGVAINGYEGGQMPLYMRMPKRGFNAWRPKSFAEVSLRRVQAAIDAKKLDVKGDVTADALKAAGVVTRIKDGVKLIGNDALNTKISFKVAGATKGALASVEKAGGSVEIVETKTTTAEATEEKKPAAKKAPAKKTAAKKPAAKKTDK